MKMRSFRHHRECLFLFSSWLLISLFVLTYYSSSNINVLLNYTAIKRVIKVNNYVVRDGSQPVVDSIHHRSHGLTHSTKDNSSHGQSCVFPKLDPFDRSLLKFIKHPRTIHCKKIQEDFTYVDGEGKVRLNTTLIRRLEREYRMNIRCNWKVISKGEGHKDAIDETEFRAFNRSSLLDLADGGGTIQVECHADNNMKNPLYFNLHPIPSLPLNRTLQAPSESQLSVYILILESMSTARFERHMSKLKRLMTDELGTFTFEGFNKIADNTYVNLLPLFMGKRVYTQQADMKDEFQENFSRLKSYDEFKYFVWKEFARVGYATAFIEDMPRISTFEFNRKGFLSRKPFDFYFRPFFWRMLRLAKRSSKFCFGNVPMVESQLDISRRIFERYGKTQKLFVVNFHVDLGHDTENDIERADDTMTQHISRLYRGGFLNKTALFVLGDHGARYGAVRLTKNGYFEERLPFLSVTFPQWFLRKHKQISRILEVNKHRLITHFDIHKTLQHILSGDYYRHLNNGTQQPTKTHTPPSSSRDSLQRPPHDSRSRTQRPLPNSRDPSQQPAAEARGRSILYRISKSRTCKTAGIPDFYCACFQSVQLTKASSRQALQMSTFIVRHMNNMLGATKQNDSVKCATLRLSEILRVEQLIATTNMDDSPATAIKNNNKTRNSPMIRSYKVKQKDDPLKIQSHRVEKKSNSLTTKTFNLVKKNGESPNEKKDSPPTEESYKVMIRTSPGEGIFETLVKYNVSTNEYKISHVISRLNKYGSRGSCVQRNQKFCYCPGKRKVAKPGEAIIESPA